MSSPFWLNNPGVLFKKDQISQVWPIETMSSEEKLNAISRLVIIMTILGYIITQRFRIIITGLVTLLSIVILQRIQSKQNTADISKKEGFTNPELYKALKDNFTTPTVVNPVMNVLLTERSDNPNRAPAAPAYNSEVEKEMNEKTKEFIGKSFNDPDIDKKLFSDLGDNYTFNQSMRTWYATPNTTIPNDQKGFAEFCYGNMTSCKEPSEGVACTKDNPRWINY
jgi:hypothetical protein